MTIMVLADHIELVFNHPEEGSEHQVKITAESDNVIVDDANIHDRYTITIPEIEPSGELPDHSVKIKITNKIGRRKYEAEVVNDEFSQKIEKSQSDSKTMAKMASGPRDAELMSEINGSYN